MNQNKKLPRAAQTFASMVARNTDWLLREARSRTNNTEDAEDLVQDVFIRFFPHWDVFEGKGNIARERGYLRTTLGRRSIDISRAPEEQHKGRTVSLDQTLKLNDGEDSGRSLGDMIEGDSLGDDKYVRRLAVQLLLEEMLLPLDTEPSRYGLATDATQLYRWYHIDEYTTNELSRRRGQSEVDVKIAIRSVGWQIIRKYTDLVDEESSSSYTLPREIISCFDTICGDMIADLPSVLKEIDIKRFQWYFSNTNTGSNSRPAGLGNDGNVSTSKKRVLPDFSARFKGRHSNVIEQLVTDWSQQPYPALYLRSEVLLLGWSGIMIPQRGRKPHNATNDDLENGE